MTEGRLQMRGDMRQETGFINMNTADMQRRLAFAVQAAREAGRGTLQYFRRDNFSVDRKADDSPVTIADRRAEEMLREAIGRAFPQDAILGEEFGEIAGTSGYRWILDPIDGTQSFIHGVPLYATLVAMEREGESVLGVICLPAVDECVYAAVGEGAWQVVGDGQPRRASVSKQADLAKATFLTSEVDGFNAVGRHDVYMRLQAAVRVSRTWGDGYGYAMVATGRAELMVDPRMAVWDAAAMLPIMQEAGGTFTDWQGKATVNSGQGVASNGLVFDAAMELINGQ